jgi:hypothetical protein
MPGTTLADCGGIAGINLGSDFCAEHEWGIKDIKIEFGIPSDLGVYGIKRRQITRVPPHFNWVACKKTAGFVLHPWLSKEPEKLAGFSELSDHYKYDKKPVDPNVSRLRAAWDESSFGVVSDRREDKDSLNTIYTQFEKKNIIIMMAGNALPVFDNPGLVIGIADAMSEEILKAWYDHDKEHHRLRKDFDATGIEKLLREKGKQYHALTPHREKDGSMRFWLNPRQQQDNNYGWFKLEDLQEWAEGNGKIPVKKPQPASK